MSKDEVIKCRDCKYCIVESYIRRDKWYHNPNICFLHSTKNWTVVVKKDDFCSRAERREDA